MKPLIEAENLSKSYQTGERGFRSLRDSFYYWWRETLAHQHGVGGEKGGPGLEKKIGRAHV